MPSERKRLGCFPQHGHGSLRRFADQHGIENVNTANFGVGNLMPGRAVQGGLEIDRAVTRPESPGADGEAAHGFVLKELMAVGQPVYGPQSLSSPWRTSPASPLFQPA